MRLIEKSQLEIAEVSLVSVTDQFLAYLANLDHAPSQTIAEFTTMATRLVLIKSRSLLPRPAVVGEDAEATELVYQLLEYQAIRDAARVLGERDHVGLTSFGRGDDAISFPGKMTMRLAMHDSLSLARLIRRRVTVITAPRQIVAMRRMVSIREMIERVLNGLQPSRPTAFHTICGPRPGRIDLMTAFLAVLVLVRRRVIDADQGDLFGPIMLAKIDPALAGVSVESNELVADG